MPTSHVLEPSRQTPVYGDYEVVVVGGGPAGIAAAIAAGRAGRSTICIERYGFCGGAGTAAGLSTFCGLHAVVHGEHEQVVHGIADDILARLARMEERDALAEFGDSYRRYMQQVPAFIPRLGGGSRSAPGHG